MKKDVKEVVEFIWHDILILTDRVSKLNEKLEDLDEALAFQNGSINTLEMTVKKLSDNFHGTQKIDPYTINISRDSSEAMDKASEALEKALEELTPKRVTDGLKRLYNKTSKTFMDDVNETVDRIILEKKIREDIIAKLELEAKDNLCDCGDTCTAFDNGFAEAIYFIRNM